MFFSNNSSNSKNLIWLLKIQAEPRFRLNYFQFERDCKGKKHFLISKHLSVFFNFHLGKNSLLNYRWFRLAGANVATFSFPPNFWALFFVFFMFFFKTRYYITENQIIKYNSNQAVGPHTHYTLIYRKLHLTHYFKQAFSHHPAKLSPMILASHFFY